MLARSGGDQAPCVASCRLTLRRTTAPKGSTGQTTQLPYMLQGSPTRHANACPAMTSGCCEGSRECPNLKVFWAPNGPLRSR
eukprot:4972288-Prymnesium_polylepis.2